jgi:hypothetical protein
MPAVVTLNVYSGRTNPSWVLSDDHAHELLDRVHSLQTKTHLKAASSVGGLGYRGFTVSSVAQSTLGALSLAVHEGVVDPGATDLSVFNEDREIEKWLLESGGHHVEADVAKHVNEALATSASDALEARSKAVLLPPPVPVCTPKAADAPPYNPGKWNVPNVQPFNNCYNYANDHITNTFAQPGRAHNKKYTQLTCASVQPAAIADGLSPTANFQAHLGPGKGWYVALVIWPGNDYHWYRQDQNGCWSHKPGGTAARNVDSNGKIITDPKTAARGPYTIFCTYMITNRSVVIR